MSSRCVRTWASFWLRSGIAASSRWQYTLCVGFICIVFALRSNLGFGSASQWHRSVFTLCCKPLSASQWHRSGIAASSRTWASVLKRSGITVSSRCAASLFRRRSGIAVASQLLHAGNAGLATASQWHRSVFTLAMQASLRLRSGIAVASQCLHTGNASLASASQRHRSVFTL